MGCGGVHVPWSVSTNSSKSAGTAQRPRVLAKSRGNRFHRIGGAFSWNRLVTTVSTHYTRGKHNPIWSTNNRSYPGFPAVTNCLHPNTALISLHTSKHFGSPPSRCRTLPHHQDQQTHHCQYEPQPCHQQRKLRLQQWYQDRQSKCQSNQLQVQGYSKWAAC